MRRMLPVMMLLLAALAGCAASDETTDGATVTVDAFAAAIAKDGVVVLDVRTPQEFASGHIAGAANHDVNGSGFASTVEGLDSSKTYAVYCRSGNRSATAMNIMRAAGLKPVFHLGGGIGAWTRAGQPVVTG